jgi:hypothetical protein
LVAIFTTDVLFEDVTFGAANHGSAELRKFSEFQAAIQLSTMCLLLRRSAGF